MSFPTPLISLSFFPHTFFQVALQSYEDRDNVWPGVTCGGFVACLFLEKEYYRLADRFTDRLPFPWNNPESSGKRKGFSSNKSGKFFQVIGVLG